MSGFDEDGENVIFFNSWADGWTYEYASRRSSHYANSLFDPNDVCHNCGELSSLCISCGLFGTHPHLSFGQDLPTTIFHRNGNRNAASPPQRQEMESSSGAGAPAAAPLPENPYTDHESSGMTLSGTLDANQRPPATMAEHDLSSLLDTPDPSRYLNHFQASNLRGSAEGDDSGGRDSEAARALNNLANWPKNLPNGEQPRAFDHLSLHETTNPIFYQHAQNGMLPDGLYAGEQSQQPFNDVDIDPQNAKAYAKLVFADGDLFITTHDVMLGRNMERFEQLRRRKKQERRAREELDTYRKEPSQPSQPGDEDHQGDPSNSSQSLEGRPAPPSNFSEHGGPVWYPPHSDGEAETQRTKPKRRVSHFSKSSSTTSVAPANLHPSTMSDLSNPYNEPDVRTFAFIPIHTRVAEDITKISKEHLMFSFNFQEEQWELKVVGNRAFVNEELFEKGTVVPLQHNDEIIIATIHMVFKLPDNFRQSPGLSRGTFSKHSDEEEVSDEESDSEERVASTSPVRRLSNALEAENSESEEEEQPFEERATRKKPNLKLQIKSEKAKPKAAKVTTKKASKKAGWKRPARRESANEQSPKAAKKPEKGKKPKTAENEEAEELKEQNSSPTAPFIKPGSALEGIPLEELPEKRKGPGRPPKEGNVSKRDTALANKKRKEYERRGEEPPPFKDLVAIVRRENKAKELQARMVASGQLEPGMDVMPSIEAEASASAPGRSRPTNDGTSTTPTEPIKRSPPRPKRTVRALSPVKPLAECTEEDLKKPDRTYVHILDEVLRNHSGGGADLPDIYERMQKRHPYFKYRCKTLGWQSSVRHNLQQSPRFTDVGKAGKGKLWAIDWDSPLEKEKKRKVTPPKQPMHNGQFIPGQMPHPQYGQAQYGNPYGQHLPNGQPGLGPQSGQGTYYSPYAQPGQPGQFGGHAQPGPNGTSQTPTYPTLQQPPPSHQQAGPQVPQNMSKLVEELIQFHGRHVSQYVADPTEQERQRQLLKDVTEYLSAYFHDKEPNANIRERIVSSDDKKLYEKLENLFKKHRPDLVVPCPFENDTAAVQDQGGQPDGIGASLPVSGEGATGIDSAHQSPDAPALGDAPLSKSDIGGESAPASVRQEASQPTPELAQQRELKRAAEDDEQEPEAKRRKNSDA